MLYRLAQFAKVWPRCILNTKIRSEQRTEEKVQTSTKYTYHFHPNWSHPDSGTSQDHRQRIYHHPQKSPEGRWSGKDGDVSVSYGTKTSLIICKMYSLWPTIRPTDWLLRHSLASFGLLSNSGASRKRFSNLSECKGSDPHPQKHLREG